MRRTAIHRNLRHLVMLAATCSSAIILSSACSDDDKAPAGTPADGDAGVDTDGDSDDAAFIDGSGGNAGDSSLFDVGGDSADADCGGQAINAAQLPTNLLVIIDRSGSMNQKPTGFIDTKWVTMVGSLKTALTGIQSDMSTGLLFFPDPNVPAADGCGMPSGDSLLINVAPGTTTVPLISAELDKQANQPSGNTPTADALALAHAYFTTGAGKDLEGKSYVLLALDGGPNCNSDIECDAAACTANVDRSPVDPTKSSCPLEPASCCGDGSDLQLNKSCLDDARSVSQVTALASAGIPTFVVGIPGSDLYTAVLDALAEEGGVAASTTSPKYFQVSDPQSLTDTLISITKDLVRSCEFQLEETPPDPDKVNVIIDGEPLVQPGDDGWHYDNSTDPPTIVITGATCEKLKAEGAESVTFSFGCPTEMPK